jgi:hypothetical protein
VGNVPQTRPSRQAIGQPCFLTSWLVHEGAASDLVSRIDPTHVLCQRGCDGVAAPWMVESSEWQSESTEPAIAPDLRWAEVLADKAHNGHWAMRGDAVRAAKWQFGSHRGAAIGEPIVGAPQTQSPPSRRDDGHETGAQAPGQRVTHTTSRPGGATQGPSPLPGHTKNGLGGMPVPGVVTPGKCPAPRRGARGDCNAGGGAGRSRAAVAGVPDRRLTLHGLPPTSGCDGSGAWQLSHVS